MKKGKPPISAEDLLRFFEKTTNVQFVDANTGNPVLETIAKNATNKAKEEESDYDLWLEEQSDDVKQEHKMGAF